MSVKNIGYQSQFEMRKNTVKMKKSNKSEEIVVNLIGVTKYFYINKFKNDL